ncbi:Ig-like domain-containing protein [uncultured Victivallis sp.]|uniref:Ig-like domain-containing protein n=1 Tax=uncultured Victivallis sp. TaxID=354118 RepID=UPI0025FD35D8|nr:Ig-like domain-containing protein [uncultured Victivallis sp.]
MAINYDEATGGYTEESTTLKPNSNGTINVDEASYVASVNDIHKGTSIVNSANDTSALAETIDNSTTIYVTGTGAYTPNVNLIDEGKIVFGKKDAAFDGTYAGTIDGQASNLATVQVLNGSLTLESGATIDLIGNFDKERGFILGTVDAAEDDGTMTAVVTVKEGATLNARNYFWIGSANGSYETPEEQSERFKLIIDGGKVDATSNAFTLRNTGAMEILNGGSFSAHDGSVRNYISVTGEGSYLEYGGNVYGEAPSGAEGAPTYGTAYITVSDGATANFTNLSIGGEGASRENRRGSVTLSNATATAKTILLSLANEDEEIRAELSVENSSLTAETITSYGAFNVSGTSTLNIDTLNIGTQEPQDDPMLLLDNAVTLLDGAVLTDSNVGGIVSTEGDVTIAGATTLGQLVLEGSRGDERTIVIDENANVTLNDQKNTNFGVLDVGIGLQKPSVTTQDPNPRQYYGQVLVKGNLSVENYNADTGEGRAGAIYIRPYAELVVTGTLNVKGEVHNRGSLVVDGGTMNMSAWATPKLLGYTTGDSMTVTNKGTMTVSGASAVTFGEASASQQHMNVDAQYTDGMFATISAGGKFEADTLAFANDDDVTLTVTGKGSTFTLYSADGRTVAGGYTYAQNEGKIIIEDKAVFDVSELANDNFVNTGTIDISSATATFATLTNDGTVNFKGGTEFSNTLTGSGTVVYTGEGNRITGGSVSNTKFIVGLENPDAVPTSLEISGGAAVEVTGGGNCGRFAPESDVVITGDGTTFTVYANLTMDESATLAISDGATVNIGYLATGGKTDVTGATLNLTGSVPGKPASAGASAIGGLDDATVFNVSDGGVVNAQAGLVIGHRETKDAEVNVNAGGELNVSGGALYVSGLVGNYTTKGNGVLNIDGGKVTASNGGDFGLYVGDDWGGASGVLNVTNGGSLTAGFSVQFYATSVVTVDGGEITVNQLYQSEGGKLSIVNGGSVTLTNSYFGMGGEITVGGDDSGAVSTFESAALVGAEAASLGGDYGEHEGETVLNILENGEAIFGSGLKVGHRADASVSKDATVNVEEGGRMEVAKTLQIGSVGDAEAVGVVNVNGGDLEASTADVGLNERSSLNIDGGSFSAQSVTNNGAINVTGEAVVDAEFAATKTGAFTITDATLGQGTNIQFGAMNVDELLPAVTLKGTVTVTDGAYLNTGREGNLTMGFGTGDSGTLNITDGAQVSLGGALYFGSEEALADDGMFYLNISGEGSRLQSDGYNGEFYITGDAVVTVSNGGTIANNARVRSGATYIFGSVDDTVAANVSFRSMELVEQANVTIQGGAVADLGILVFGDQYMGYDGSFTLAADGQLKLNSYSALSGEAEIAVSGMDDTFSGVWKLIDNTGSNTLDYSAMISNWNDISGSVAVVENDLYRVNVDMTTLKVNAAWSTLDIGEQVADGFYYGFNAFDNLDKVYSTIAAGGVSQIELQSNVQLENGNPPISDMWFKFQDDVTIDSDVAGETRTITLSGHELLLTSMDQSRGNGGQQISITLGKDINILTDSAIWFGYCYDDADTYPEYAGNFATDITLNGSITMTSGQAHIFGHGSTMTITETGSLTVAGSDIQTRGSHLIVNGSGKEMAQAQVQLNHENIEGDSPLVITGDDFVDSPAAASWTLNNTFVNIKTFLGINTATDSRASGIDAALKMNNSRLTVGQNLTMADAATVQLDNQSELSIGGNIELGFGQTIDKGASITVNNSSQLVAANLSIDEGTSVNIGKNSEVTITGGITNNGAIVTDYTSTLAFGNITNDGTITIDTEGFSSGIYKILDYTGTGTGTYTKDQYEALLGNHLNDSYTVVNNDLYLTNLDGSEVRYVNSAWSSSNPYDEVMFVDGTRAYYGQNAFDTVANALSDTSYDKTIRLNVTGEVGAIIVVGTNVTEVNVSAKPADLTGDTVIDADAIVVNLVEIDNTNAGWQVYYPLAGDSNAQVYGNITTNFLSTTFTAWGEKTADPNFIGGAYAGSTATVYGNTTVNLGAVDAADDTLQLDTSFLMGAGAGTVNGNSSVNINSGTVEADAIVGGAAWRGQVKGDSSVTISGGEITLVGTSTYSAVYGGSYGNVSYDPDAPGDPAATARNTSVTIKGDAVVNGKVIGGSDQTAVTGTTVEISGEAKVNGNVYAGGNRGGQVTGNTSVTLTGGTVTGNVYGGGDNSSVIGDTSVVVNGADVGAGIFGGSLNGNVNNTVVEISNFTRLQPVSGTQSDKIQIVGGGMAEAGKSSTTASTNVTVTDSKIYGDVVAGSSATGTGATAISGKSVVNVSNLEINGYSEGSNIWTGRVFGAGRAQYGGSVVTESTDVTIENMSGYTYDSEGNVIDGSNKGARVYGAGQAYASMSRVEVGETKLRISGDATNISEIYGGGIVSGTEVQEKAAFQIVGKTDVEITGGTVTDVIAGGNNTNWFGRTVIGVDAGDGTYQAAEGEYGIRLVIGGSTKVNEGALVTGGSYVDFAYEYQNIVDGVDTYGRTAEIYGNTYMELTGDSVISTDVFGGSFAYYEQVDFSADVSKLSAPSATQYGDVTVVVSGNTAIAGSVYGGGAVLTNTDQVKTTSVTNGDVSVLISGGAVGGNVYAGGYYADVNGNASVTLSGGTVGGDIYGGSEGSGTVAGSSTLNVGATDAARYTTTLNNVYDFDVANITNAAVTVEGVFSATQISIADSTLTLNSGFDAATTTVSIEVGAYNAENAALVLGSAEGTAPAISISAGSNALTEARYLVATGFDDTTAFSLDESLAGEYILRAVDGNIYLYNADAPYFTTELSVTQAEGASVDGYYSFTANFEAVGLLTGYTLKLYDSATATTPVDEVTLDADVIGQEFTLENTTQSFWISVTANGENGLSTDSPTSGRLEVVVKDYDSPVIQSVSSNVASDAITLTCEATDNFGVTGYEFILDGQSLGVQTGSEIALDLSTLAAGTHGYTVNVYDAAGNLATSAEQSFDFTPEPGPGPEPTEPANFLYSSQVRMNNGETVSVYATYSDAAAALEYRIGDSGEWLTYDATTGVNVSSSTTVYFREQGITDPVETAVDVTVVPADVELNAEVILLAPTTDTTYEVIYNFADGGSKAVELSGNSVEHYALPEDTKITIVEKDASGEVVNTIVEETPAASTTAEIPDKVVAVDDGHDNLFFAMPVGKWTGNRAQHQGDGVWGGTLEVVSLTGKNRFSTVFTGSDDATTLFLTDDANGDAFFLDDIYTANGSDARIRKMSEIQAGAGDDIVDLTSVRYAYEEHASKQLVIRGGDGNDILWGNAGHNIMFGDDGNDKIYGGSDNDVLIGGTGNDTMLGGGGDDIFCYGSSFDWGSDTITQLAGGTVTLYLDGIDRNDCSISGSTLTWNDGTHTGSITLNGVSWDSVKFYCAANGDGDLTKQSDYEELKNKGAFAAISSH